MENTKFDNHSLHLNTEITVFYWARLKVADIMTRDVVTVAPSQSIQEAALLMTEKHISCVLVSTDNQLLGILSQKDLMDSTLTSCAPTEIQVCDRMSQAVETIDPKTPALHASMIMDTMGVKRLPVVSEEGLVGLVTQTDLVHALESMSALRSVIDIMTEEIAAVEADQSVARAVEMMAQKGISSVLVMCHGKAEGILTEKDVLRTVLAQGKDPEQTCVVEVMTFPLITVPSSHSVMSASRLMDDKRVHRLVVVDEDQTLGIVTRTDIIKGYQAHAQRETQQEMRMLANAVDPIILLDPEGNTIYANPAFLKLFGADSPEVFVDKPFPPDVLCVNPQEKTQFITKQSFEGGGLQRLFLRKVDGGYVSINLCFSDVKDLDGNVIGKQGAAWDMSQEAV
ncbi:CBS domain-containing protein [Planctomycetota bacterium]